jgi:tRNA A-37 threonylcarbamoyl transferase component Bud32
LTNGKELQLVGFPFYQKKHSLFRGRIDGEEVIVKMTSSKQNMLAHEALVYQKLACLQGKYIPRLIYHGFCQNNVYLIILSNCGPMSLREGWVTTAQKRILSEALAKIHKAGITHGSIDYRNIVVNGSGRPFFIDFERSKPLRERDRELERALLAALH